MKKTFYLLLFFYLPYLGYGQTKCDTLNAILPCDTVNKALNTDLGTYFIPDSGNTYSIPFATTYLSIRYSNYNLYPYGWSDLIGCCSPYSVNTTDSSLSHCDSAEVLFFGMMYNLPQTDSCMPAWLYNAMLPNLAFSNGDTTINMLCSDLAKCNFTCLNLCPDTLRGSCDSIRSYAYVYRQLLHAEGLSVDTTLLDNCYAFLYGNFLPYASIMTEINNCNPNDTAVLTKIVYTAKNVNYSDSSGQYFLDFDVFASDTPVYLLFAQSNIFITYDSTIFGTNLVSSGKITASKGMAVDSPYYNLSLTDSTSTMLKIAITHTPSPASLANLDSVNQQLCHLRVNVTGFSTTSVAAYFDTLSMAGHSEYQQTTSGLEFPYDKILVSGLVGGLRADDDSINFSIANAALDSPGAPTYLDFDIIGSATISNVNLGGYTVKVKFNQNAFDNATVTDIIANGCGDDGMGLGGGGGRGGDSIYDFNWAYVPGSVTISLGYNDNYDPTDSDQSQVYNQIQGATPLAHVRLHISDCHYLPDVVIDPSVASATWYDTSIISFALYNPTYIGPGYTDTLCTPLPNIIAWDPPCTNAGDFQVVTIWGQYFGSTSGTVYFTNANYPGSFVHTLPQDILHWEDDTIRLLIPSALSNLAPGLGTAGSGTFYVQTAGGLNDSTDRTFIAISHADRNIRSTDGYAHFVYLQDTPYVFQLSSALYYYPGVMESVRYVFADLRCQTGINFQVDTVNASPVDTPANDGINLISEQPDNASVWIGVDSAAVAITVPNTKHASTGLSQYNDNASYVVDIDITLRSSAAWNWWMYLTNLTLVPWQYDAPSVLTHELGHAAMLMDALPEKSDNRNVMYPSESSGEEYRGYDNDSNSILGMKYGMSLGAILGVANGHPAMVPVFPSGCPTVIPTVCVNDGATGIRQVMSSTGFSASLYPNPYQNTTIVHVNVSQYGNYSIVLYDLVGHLIMERAISTNESFDIPLSGFDFSAGMYLVQVSDSHSSVTLKLIKL